MGTDAKLIRSVESPALDELCQELRELGDTLTGDNAWPTRQLELCGEYGVYRWFFSNEWEGFAWSEPEIVAGYRRLAAACLTTTFVITQRVAACRRIVGSENHPIKSRLIPDLASGASFATVGISHLTTSRRHLAKPVLRAEPVEGGFVVDGFSPWVTGGNHADQIVTGATLPDDRQILFVMSPTMNGVQPEDGFKLVGLTASQTGAVRCDSVFIEQQFLLGGPTHDIMLSGAGGGTGGLQTSTLAIGLATEAVSYIRKQSIERPELQPTLEALDEQLSDLNDRLLQKAGGNQVCTNEELRTDANSLVLRATQSALVAAKGAGYVQGHAVGRWCQEALFFLVWSCPQTVLEANLCELAGLEL